MDSNQQHSGPKPNCWVNTAMGRPLVDILHACFIILRFFLVWCMLLLYTLGRTVMEPSVATYILWWQLLLRQARSSLQHLHLKVVCSLPSKSTSNSSYSTSSSWKLENVDFCSSMTKFILGELAHHKDVPRIIKKRTSTYLCSIFSSRQRKLWKSFFFPFLFWISVTQIFVNITIFRQIYYFCWFLWLFLTLLGIFNLLEIILY